MTDPLDVDRLADVLDDAAGDDQVAAVALAGDLFADALAVLASKLEHAGAGAAGARVATEAGRIAASLARILDAVTTPNAVAALAQGCLL